MIFRPGRRLAAVILAAAIVLPVWRAPVAAAGESLEGAVKAAYLYRFGDFVQWPASAFAAPASALNLCVTGEVPFGDSLAAAAAGKRVAGRPIVVRRLARVTRGSGCQILYVGGSDARRVAAALDAVRGAPMLTVTDTAGTPGVISFVIEGNHVRFAIDDRAASLNGLVISSKLLSLALSVSDRN